MPPKSKKNKPKAPRQFVLSDGGENSYGFAIDMTKLHLQRFLSNPVMLHNHAGRVGSWDGIITKDGQLLAVPSFVPNDADADKVKNQVDTGHLRGASLGINIIDIDWSGDVPLAEVEVLEASVVDIPSNATALSLSANGKPSFCGVVLMNTEGQLLSESEVKLSLQKPNLKPQKTMNKLTLTVAAFAALSLANDATAEEVSAKIEALKAENVSLTEKLGVKTGKKAKKLVNAALAAGKITADEVDEYLELATAKFEFTEKQLSKLPGKKTLKADETNTTVVDLVGREKWTLSDWKKKDMAGLINLKTVNRNAYDLLFASEGIDLT